MGKYRGPSPQMRLAQDDGEKQATAKATTEILRLWLRMTSMWVYVSPAFNSAVGERGALADLNAGAIRVADVAANHAVLRDRRGEELSSAAVPELITGLNVGDPDVQEAVDVVRV